MAGKKQRKDEGSSNISQRAGVAPEKLPELRSCFYDKEAGYVGDTLSSGVSALGMHAIDIMDPTFSAFGTAERLLSLDGAALLLKPTSYLDRVVLLYEASLYGPPRPGSERA